MEPKTYEILIGCEIDDDGDKITNLIAANEDSEGDFMLMPGDALLFSMIADDTLDGSADPGSYAIVTIPQDGIVAPEDQFIRLELGERRRVEVIDDPLEDDEDAQEERFSLVMMVFTEYCGCLCGDKGGEFREGPEPVPVVKRKKKKRRPR